MFKGRGLSKAEIGLRLSYDILDRTISPYVGVIWEPKFGGTANIHRDEGKDIEAWYATLGMRILF